MIIGHRGAAGLAPENTLAAFQIALDRGVTGIEFDVQRTADGELIVFHDDDVDRVTDGSGPLRQFTLADLKTLDTGSWFDARFRGERIPTLAEVLAFLRGQDVVLHIELKSPWYFEGIERQVVDLVRQMKMVDQVWVRSFYHPALHTVHAIAPEFRISELWYDMFPQNDEITYPMVNVSYELCTAERIAHIHEGGRLVTAWTVNDIEVAHQLAAMGIDGLTTDYPDRLR